MSDPIDPILSQPDVNPSVDGSRDLDRLSIAKQERMQRDMLTLMGRHDQMVSREKKLTDDVGQAKGRIGLKPEVDGVLEELQKRAHDRSVGAFERMLTGITDDVLPDYRGQRTVRLELTTERNMPALDIFIDHLGNREEITSGAVANVVSTGLRFIALARSGARPFLVLDEADCWIDGVAVQNYFNVVKQLSEDAGIQTVVITHHDLSAFAEDFRIYRITDVESQDGIPARNMDLVSPGKMAINELNENPLSFIGLKNIEAYPQAAIELSPGVTVIQGANQRGKSTWARVLRAAFMADGGDAIVRHRHAAGEVSIGFADGRVLEYQRNRKGLPKAEFALHSPDSWAERMSGTPLKDMREGPVRALRHTVGAKLPEWVPGETGIYAIDDINVQLWGQFTPVFMLDRPPSARASLLSIGRESGYLFAMSETFKEDVKSDNAVVREGEKEIAAIRAMVKTLEPLPELMKRLDVLQSEAKAINDEAKEVRDIGQLLGQMRALRECFALLDRERMAHDHLIETPKFEPTERLGVWLADFKRARKDGAIEIRTELPAIPAVEETALLKSILSGFDAVRDAQAKLSKLPVLPAVPEIQATTEVGSLLASLRQARKDASLTILTPVPEPFEVLQTAEAGAILQGLSQARRDAGLIVQTTPPELPAIHGTTEIGGLLQSLKVAKEGALAHEKQLKALQAEMEAAERDLQAAADALGNECPVCHSIMTVDMLLGKDGHDHRHELNSVLRVSDGTEGPRSFDNGPAPETFAAPQSKTSFVAADITEDVVAQRARDAAEVAEAAPKVAQKPTRLSFRR